MRSIKDRNLLLVGLLALAAALFVAPWTVRAEELTNARVIEMSQKGLGDEIIIAKIKNGQPHFNLGDQDLLDLKKANVSDKVVAAMLESAVIRTAHVFLNGAPLELHTLAQAKIGGRLGHMASMGLKSTKWKAYLQDPTSKFATGASPKIELELPSEDSADNYLIVAFEKKEDRREIEVGSGGGAVGQKTGLKAEAIVPTTKTQSAPNRFLLSPSQPLKFGEYMVYVVGSVDTTKGISGRGYDFSVR
jgi:hypothetical protein